MTVARRRSRLSFATTGIEHTPHTLPTFALHDKGDMQINTNIGDSGLSRGPIGDDLDPDLESIPTMTEVPRTNSEPSMPTRQSRPEIEEIHIEPQNSDAGTIFKCRTLKLSWSGRRVYSK
jgi:hypothetical protein